MTYHSNHPEGRGCPMCAGAMAHRKKLLAVEVFFGLMAIGNTTNAGVKGEFFF